MSQLHRLDANFQKLSTLLKGCFKLCLTHKISVPGSVLAVGIQNSPGGTQRERTTGEMTWSFKRSRSPLSDADADHRSELSR